VLTTTEAELKSLMLAGLAGDAAAHGGLLRVHRGLRALAAAIVRERENEDG